MLCMAWMSFNSIKYDLNWKINGLQDIATSFNSIKYDLNEKKVTEKQS